MSRRTWPRGLKPLGYLSLLAIAAAWALPAVGLGAEFESYLNYIGTRPTEAETPYSEECNGIAHDQDNWFIAQNVDNGKVWKIPVTVDLAGVPGCGSGGVICNTVNAIPALSGYNHIGGIDHYQTPSHGFLVLSLEGPSGPSIGVLDGAGLQYVSHQLLATPPGWSSGYSSCSWVAIDPSGNLYTSSNSRPGRIQRYAVNWTTLDQGGALALTYLDEFTVLDEQGVLLDIGPQGGVFSPSGNLLYVNNGYYDQYTAYKDGLSVIDMATKRRVAKSTTDPSDAFWYGYITGTLDAEEPEGLTFWDLDADGRSPHSGQLHVLVLDNDLTNDDDVYIRHYSEKIFVDGHAAGPGNGKPDTPFPTVDQASGIAWDGCRIVVEAGTYGESVVLSDRMELLGRGGIVEIGP